TLRVINRPQSPNFLPEGVIEDLKQFAGQCIIQTMMLRGEWEGKHFDNTTDDEVNALIEAYKAIQPREVMLYSLDRKTPADHLVKIEHDELQAIGDRIAQATGIPVQVN
ncbi:MAG: radical SAM protein, partial [Muribaculaceae bacterium]|nr:radical SAM protein [Muribaculaceae bacterium]